MFALFLFAGIGVLTNFEGGNVGQVEHVSATRLRCAVQGQADQDHRNRQASWYYFELENLPNTEVTVDLVNIAGEYNYQNPAYAVTKGTRPVFSYDRVNWTHFRDDQVSWDEKEPHLTLRFTPERERIWIAHVPPYTNEDLDHLLAAFSSSRYLARESAGRTLENRGIPLLTITDPSAPEANKKVIWLMFRQHAWESGSSWACDGAVRFLLSSEPTAARIRSRVIFKIFPMADPDGVAAGRVRFNGNGYDLNRNWDTIDPRKMPEITAQRKAIYAWLDAGHRIDAFLSLHNTERNEYLEGPEMFRPLCERIFRTLQQTTTFNPTTPFRDSGSSTTPGKPGRMNVAQGLFHDRKLPVMIMEQMIENNSKLGHCPTIADRREFGAGLVRAFAEAVRSAPGR